ncbi:MAG: acetolactate synthase small subunit [Thermomicrobiales bacterium]
MENHEFRTLVVLVENETGVLNRVMSLFRQRMFNIESVAVGHTEMPGISRMTFVLEGDDYTVEQVTKQLYKLLEVIKVTELTGPNLIQRELALIKVNATDRTRSDIMRIATDIFRARVVDASPDTLTLEVTGPIDKIDSLIAMIRTYGIKEVARTGSVAMVRGSGTAGLRVVNTAA